MPSDLNVINAAQIAMVRDHGGPRKGSAQDELDLVPHGVVAIRNGLIVAVGEASVLREFGEDVPTLDAAGGSVVPGFVECHSHPLFAGNRHWEYVQRLHGASSREIRAAGGGIWSTILATRKADDQTLLDQAARAYRAILRGGVTTLEVKSGYGQNPEQELRLLGLLRQSAASTPMDLVYTFLGAHIAPQDGLSAEAYARQVREEMLPAVVRQGIADFQDLSCEEGDFSAPLAQELLEASRRVGLPARVHADASSPSRGWSTAVAGGAVSADHLTYTPDEEIRAVGSTDTVAVLLPTAEQFYLDPQRANARLFIQENVPVAIATDYCSSFQATSMALSISLACSWFHITPAEAIVGATLNAAYALRRNRDRGSIEVGKRGDLTVLDCAHPNELGTRIGAPLIRQVVAQGRVIHRS
ncbi:MAG: imidazolonepropionase [Holophaga sp.]|nr:imidazolonepropionase [Holophaga sp.]